MKVSQKLENACRVLVQLAKGYDGSTVHRVEDLASKEGLSANFLLQILNDLRRGGVVESRRGKFGGYRLARRPEEITLKAVVEAIEGVALEAEAQAGGESGPSVARTWAEVAARFEGILDGVALSDMMANTGDDTGVFYI